jgi:rubrerythrin
MQEEVKSIMTNTEYNVSKQLDKKLEFLWHVDSYIQDAERDSDREAADTLRKIKDDEQNHARMLKQLLLRSVSSR